MKSLVIAATFVVAAVAHARSPVQPDRGAPACFKREYTHEHLRRHPRQRLSAIYVMVQGAPVINDGSTAEVPRASVVGVSGGELYSNLDPLCEYKADGTTHCFVECDGGAFNLRPRQRDVLFSVKRDYYFPLYRAGTEQETATEADTISLDAGDRENSVFRLHPAPLRECEAAKERAQHGRWSCY